MAGEVYVPKPKFPIERWVRTGFVFVRDFDLGMARSIIGSKEQTAYKSDSDRFYVDFPQFPTSPQNEQRATIIFKTPEPTLQWNVFPRIMISRDAVTPALQRWHPISREYMIEAATSQEISIPGPTPDAPPRVGPSQRESKIQAWPFDITYTIECWHRFDNWALAMVFRVMKSFPPYGMMKLRDSLNEERSYDAFGETGPTQLTEVLSMTDRGAGYSWTVRVTGELDLDDPVTLETVRAVNPTLYRIDPLAGPFD